MCVQMSEFFIFSSQIHEKQPNTRFVFLSDETDKSQSLSSNIRSNTLFLNVMNRGKIINVDVCPFYSWYAASSPFVMVSKMYPFNYIDWILYFQTECSKVLRLY